MPIENFYRLLGHPSYALTRATAERMGLTLKGTAEICESCDLAKIRANSIKAEELQVSREKGTYSALTYHLQVILPQTGRSTGYDYLTKMNPFTDESRLP